LKKVYIIKGLITIALISFAVYFGVSIAKSAIFYDLYSLNADTGILVLRGNLGGDNLYRSIYHYFQLSSYTSVSYTIYLIALLTLLFLNKGKIKKHGWLFMVAILAFLFAPIELYTIFKDIEISRIIFWGGGADAASDKINEYMNFRSDSMYSLLGGLSFLSQITIFIFGVFKPLNLENEE